MDSTKTLFVIILNYNNARDTIECIKSLQSIKSINIHVIVVDNGSSKECVEMLDSFIKSNITFIKNNKNIGYAAGNNIGIKYAIENGADYISIVNNDVIVNENSFTHSIEILDSGKNIGIVGPVIIDAYTKQIQSSGANIDYPKVSVDLIRRGQDFYPTNDLIECDYVGGACMVFTPQIIEKVGYIPENYFLFWEETEWCLNAKRAGYKILCVGGSSVEHKGSATINKTDGFGIYYMERNRIIFMRRNYPNKLTMIQPMIYLLLRCLAKSIINGPSYIKVISYYIDGFLNHDRMLSRH